MRKHGLWITQYRGLEAKPGLEPKSPGLARKEKEMGWGVGGTNRR